MQKTDFASRLRKLIKKSGVKQAQIAQALGLSSAAVSYFINGKTLPKPGQLDEIMRVISAPAETIAQMQQALSDARKTAKEKNVTGNNLNHHIFSIRTYHGLSLSQLAVRTGISQKRLTELEGGQNFSAGNENDRIYKTFGNHTGKSKKGTLRLAENNNFGAPVLWLKDLCKYNPAEEPLLAFAHSNLRDFVARSFEDLDEPVLLLADCRELNFPHAGVLQIIVARRHPDKLIPMELRRYADGKFRLWQKNSAIENNNDGDVVFTIPVVEIIMQPVNVEMQN